MGDDASVLPPPSTEQTMGDDMARSCSLHIGINRRGRDDGTDTEKGILKFCRTDAWMMARIAETRGYDTTTLLLDSAATFDRVVAEVHTAIDYLRDGGIFLWTFSGHGTIVPASEPTDKIYDEGWVLSDGVLLDNCIRGLLAQFDEKASVVIVSDCCYGGDMAEFLTAFAADSGLLLHSFLPEEPSTGKQLFPLERWLAAREPAGAIGRDAAGTLPPIRTCPPQKITREEIRAAVISIGACGDTQIAADGAFTPGLSKWLDGRRAEPANEDGRAADESPRTTLPGESQPVVPAEELQNGNPYIPTPHDSGYRGMVWGVDQNLPPSQKPTIKCYGRSDELLLNGPPFSIPVSPAREPRSHNLSSHSIA